MRAKKPVCTVKHSKKSCVRPFLHLQKPFLWPISTMFNSVDSQIVLEKNSFYFFVAQKKTVYIVKHSKNKTARPFLHFQKPFLRPISTMFNSVDSQIFLEKISFYFLHISKTLTIRVPNRLCARFYIHFYTFKTFSNSRY